MMTARQLLLTAMLFAGTYAAGEANDLYSVTADQIRTDEASGVTTYQGNATVEVSNLIIEADSISVTEKNGLPTEVRASGSPISFREREARKNISGTAREVIFLVAELKLMLTEYDITDPTGNRMRGKKISFVLAP